MVNELKCDAIKPNQVSNLVYKTKSLEKVFVRYDECTNENYLQYGKKEEYDAFNLSIRPGVNFSALSLEDEGTTRSEIKFDREVSFRIGVEFEYVLPFNKNKWGIVIEPTYQYFKGEKTIPIDNVSGGELETKVDFSSLQIPFGVRYYLFLTERVKLFTNLFYVPLITMNKEVNFYRADGSFINSLEINTKPNFAFGIGANYNNKFNAEIRFFTNQDIVEGYHYWGSSFNSLSLIVGFSLF